MQESSGHNNRSVQPTNSSLKKVIPHPLLRVSANSAAHNQAELPPCMSSGNVAAAKVLQKVKTQNIDSLRESVPQASSISGQRSASYGHNMSTTAQSKATDQMV